jgi:hypothetical protein
LREDEDPLEADAEELDLGEPEAPGSTEELADDRAGDEV